VKYFTFNFDLNVKLKFGGKSRSLSSLKHLEKVVYNCVRGDCSSLRHILRDIISDYLCFKFSIDKASAEEILSSYDNARQYISDKNVLRFLFNEGQNYNIAGIMGILDSLERVLE